MIARITAVALFCLGLACLAQAQLPLTHGGLGSPTPAVPTTTFDPAKIGTGVTLSPDKLTATNVSGNTSSFAIAGATTGLKYFEVKYTVCATVGHCFIGIGNGVSLNVFLGTAPNGAATTGDGLIYNLAPGGNTSGFAINDWVGVATDIPNTHIWFKNVTAGSGWNNDILANQNPANNTGGKTSTVFGTGTIYPGVGTFSDATVATANFGATAYAGTVPTGFTNW